MLAAILATAVALGLITFVPIISSDAPFCHPKLPCIPIPEQYLPSVSVTYYMTGVGGRLVGGHYQVVYFPWTCVTSAETVECNEGYVTVF